MNHKEIAEEIYSLNENIILIYAFNGAGKTRLSVAYKDISKEKNDDNHSGVYYNAFSEDLFVWDNDESNDNNDIKLTINSSNLNKFHSFLDVPIIEEKLALYKPKYKFKFNYEDLERGFESITFFVDEETESPIKISRGEERIFVWCFFLALFEVDGFADIQNAHIFIDDPVSSLDEHNIYVTSESIFNLIEDNYLEKNIILTTHHIGLFSILADRLTRGEKSGKFKEITKVGILKNTNETLELKNAKKDVFLFHLHLMQIIDEAIKSELFAYHFVLLRQLLENISSFLGQGRISFTLEQIGIEKEKIADTMVIINHLSHKNAYKMQFNKMAEADEDLLKDIFQKIQVKYKFKY